LPKVLEEGTAAVAAVYSTVEVGLKVPNVGEVKWATVRVAPALTFIEPPEIEKLGSIIRLAAELPSPTIILEPEPKAQIKSVVAELGME
jgi:hypothetical protein